jgi:phage terminase large subunit-like protein
MSNWTPVSRPSPASSASRYLGTADEKAQFIRLLEERARRKARRRIEAMYPEEGALSRHAYPKHMEFFKAGATYRERCFMAANRIGKTEGAGGYETALHLTGLYPHWWEGRRFEEPVRGWAAGKTNETTRDIIQAKLFGDITHASGDKGFSGTGLVIGERIGKVTWKQGVSDLADKIMVKHVSGGWSELGLKSYQQGRGAFEGTERDFIWLDEEPPLDIYGECLIRTATTNGIVLMTFTPLEGLSDTVLQFLPNGMPDAGSK